MNGMYVNRKAGSKISHPVNLVFLCLYTVGHFHLLVMFCVLLFLKYTSYFHNLKDLETILIFWGKRPQVATDPEESCDGRWSPEALFSRAFSDHLPCLFSLKCSSEHHVSSLPCAGLGVSLLWIWVVALPVSSYETSLHSPLCMRYKLAHCDCIGLSPLDVSCAW